MTSPPRHEWPDLSILVAIDAVRQSAGEWLRTYSNERP
ncbi:MAG: hypothetical protein RIT14_557 [Pseudomonadota bacterium]